MRKLLFSGVAVSSLAVLTSGALGPVDAQQPQVLVIQGGTLIDSSNRAHILVPFSFTTAWSHNKY